MSRPIKPCTEAAECRSCKALVLWGEWRRSGKKMPVDVGPVATGNVVVSHNAAANKMVLDKFDPAQHAGRRRFVSHFVTCINAATHRKARP